MSKTGSHVGEFLGQSKQRKHVERVGCLSHHPNQMEPPKPVLQPNHFGTIVWVYL